MNILEKETLTGNHFEGLIVASAYSLLAQVNTPINAELWKIVWEIPIPERVYAFIWIVVHNCLLTNKRKSKMVLGTNLCSHCNEVVEDELQVLRDCPLAMSIWIGLVKPSMRSDFFGGDLVGFALILLIRGMGLMVYRGLAFGSQIVIICGLGETRGSMIPLSFGIYGLGLWCTTTRKLPFTYESYRPLQICP